MKKLAALPIQAVTPPIIIRDTPKIGRNKRCICGNRRKFKKCCGKILS